MRRALRFCFFVLLFVAGEAFAQTTANPNLQTSSAPSGTFTATYNSAYNANTQGIVFTWTWTGTAWRVTCVSGPSTGWASGSTINYSGGQFTAYGQQVTATAGSALAFGLNHNGSAVSIMTLAAGGPTAENGQTVTISPTSANLLMGAAAVFTASGGQNGYQWSISSGGGLAASGANAAYTGTAIGTYTIKVWSPAGNGYAKSNEATATVVVAESFRASVTMGANNGANPIKYLVFQNGEVVAEYIQNPGDPIRIVSVIVPSNSPLTVASQVMGVHQESNGTWTVQPGAASAPTQGTPVIPTPSNLPGPGAPIKAPEPNAANNTPSSTTGKQSGKIVWGGGGGNSDPNNQTDLLTNATFKQGADAIASNTDEILKELKEQREKQEKATDEIKDATTKEQAGYQGGMQADLAHGEAFGAVVTQGRSASSVTVAPSAPASELWSITDDNLGTFSLNPFNSPKVKQGFRSLVVWVRALVGWGIVLGLTTYVYAEMRKAMISLMTIPQHKFVVEQVVQGSQWTTLTTWVARAAVRATFVAFLIALPTACIQLFSTEWSQLALTLAASVSEGSTGTGGTDGAGVADFLALVNCVIPVATFLSAGATYAAVEFGLINLQSIWMVFFRLSK